ncbi:hypothetical protein [Sphingorhabdus sp. Alg239-R122]|uniref:hypothetical protein n=1 Tax=Sphingorhabdus sp. Alg239-R122 TaxID=2305989 RepID=UPI0013DC3946|nr:hypothetical protein [Sphingorhabdus sp. Alg239-R122]
MTRFIIFFLTLFSLAPLVPAHAQEKAIEYQGQTWRIAAQEAGVETYLGREAIKLTGGRLWADDIVFSDGVISFDTAYAEQQIFIGAGWRAQNDSRYEEMYFRGHLNKKPDALQYTPVENGNSAWQIFSDTNATGPVSQKFDDWNRVKIVVQGDSADIYFNSSAPVLHIPDLKTDIATGKVTLRSSGRGSGPTYFSNVVIRPLAEGEGVIGTAKPSAELPEGLVKIWKVSSVFHEDRVRDALSVDATDFADLSWQSLDTETNGITNLSKISRRLDNSGTVFVHLKVTSNIEQMNELRFGYSDRVRIYLNGKRIYYGNAGWRVRDYRFLGTVGFFDSVGLDLKQGDNHVIIAVSETFGGWAWAGAIKDQSNITLE